MTFCVGIKTSGGLVALADTRVVRGSERISKSKLAVLQHHDECFFVMTSGLRSVRDKLMIYAGEALSEKANRCEKMHHAANLFGRQLQRIRDEDHDALESSGLLFNLHAILGGRLRGDPEPKLFFLYPEGNWIEAADDSPYFMIGRTVYGKPLMDRLLSPQTSLAEATAVAMLAFDATRTSVTDVGFPIDLLTLSHRTGQTRQHRFGEAELAETIAWWHARLAETLPRMPMGWAAELLDNDPCPEADHTPHPA